jgi:2'-5' RNA ligase
MTDLTAVDILIEPDAEAIERAREVNRRMPLSIPAGITLDDTHLPHITMLQRYLVTDAIDEAYEAIAKTLAATDIASLSYHVPGITYSEHWGPPGQAAAVLGVEPNKQVLDLQAALVAAVGPFTGQGGTDEAFVRDPGQEISQTTRDWVETYVPDQTGPSYTPHLTVGLDTVEHLKELQAEPFDAFDVRPLGLAVYQLGNNGTARTLLKSWPLQLPA